MILKFVMRDTADEIVSGTPTVTADGDALTPTGTSALWQVDAPLGTYVVATLTGAEMREWQMPLIDGTLLATEAKQDAAKTVIDAAATQEALDDLALAVVAVPGLVWVHAERTITGNAIPEDWVAITHATRTDDDGNIVEAPAGTALGVVQPLGKITVYNGGVIMAGTTADADGEYAFSLPPGSAWTLRSVALGYEDMEAEVTT